MSPAGLHCLFPADHMTESKDPRYITPADPLRCGRHDHRNQAVALRREHEHVERAARAGRARPRAAIGDTPACWTWPINDEVRALIAVTNDDSFPPAQRAVSLGRLYKAFSRGQCAVCGNQGAPIEDHDHLSGLVRGWLCPSCNTREGLSQSAVGAFAGYRRRNPYSMLGIKELYSGWHWPVSG